MQDEEDFLRRDSVRQQIAAHSQSVASRNSSDNYSEYSYYDEEEESSSSYYDSEEESDESADGEAQSSTNQVAPEGARDISEADARE